MSNRTKRRLELETMATAPNGRNRLARILEARRSTTPGITLPAGESLTQSILRQEYREALILDSSSQLGSAWVPNSTPCVTSDLCCEPENLVTPEQLQEISNRMASGAVAGEIDRATGLNWKLDR